MKKNQWTQVGITVATVFAGAVLGMLCGSSFEHTNLFGQLGYSVNLVESSSIVFAIAAAAGCVVFFGNRDR